MFRGYFNAAKSRARLVYFNSKLAVSGVYENTHLFGEFSVYGPIKYFTKLK